MEDDSGDKVHTPKYVPSNLLPSRSFNLSIAHSAMGSSVRENIVEGDALKILLAGNQASHTCISGGPCYIQTTKGGFVKK